MRLNEIFTHENHRFSSERIFYPTKITRYTVNDTVHVRGANCLGARLFHSSIEVLWKTQR